jgi:Ser/Thr protein kinase RdoA (MazF antagonist)
VTGMIDFYFACTEAMAYDLAVTHAAWCFDKSGERFAPTSAAHWSKAIKVRPLEPREQDCLPLLAEGACLRFVASRAEDWLHTPADALVTRKDPMEFARRLQFYRDRGDEALLADAAAEARRPDEAGRDLHRRRVQGQPRPRRLGALCCEWAHAKGTVGRRA